MTTISLMSMLGDRPMLHQIADKIKVPTSSTWMLVFRVKLCSSAFLINSSNFHKFCNCLLKYNKLQMSSSSCSTVQYIHKMVFGDFIHNIRIWFQDYLPYLQEFHDIKRDKQRLNGWVSQQIVMDCRLLIFSLKWIRMIEVNRVTQVYLRNENDVHFLNSMETELIPGHVRYWERHFMLSQIDGSIIQFINSYWVVFVFIYRLKQIFIAGRGVVLCSLYLLLVLVVSQ